MIRYPLPFTVNEFRRNYLLNALQRSSLFAAVQFSDNVLEYELVNPHDSKKAENVVEQCSMICSHLSEIRLYSSGYKPAYSYDPTEDLIRSGDVSPTDKGTYAFSGVFLSFMKFIDYLFLSVAQKMGAKEYNYPVLWKVDLFSRIHYFRDFPQNIYMVAGVKKENASLESISSRYGHEHILKKIKIDNSFDESSSALGTSICDTCYYLRTGSREFSNGLYTAFGRCFRNENPENTGLDRLREFSMREIIAVGSVEYTLEQRELFVQYAIGILNFLQLAADIEMAQDPFFTNDASLKSLFQNSVNAKYELLAELPYANKKLAIGSINWHGDYFGRCFDISNGHTHQNSACIGLGYERIALAFFAQYGIDPDKWPGQVKTAYDTYCSREQQSFAAAPELKGAVHFMQETKLDKKRVNTFRGDVEKTLENIFRTVFGIEMQPPYMRTDTIESWNSLNHIRLILEIEKVFGVSIDQSDYVFLYSDFNAIVSYLKGA